MGPLGLAWSVLMDSPLCVLQLAYGPGGACLAGKLAQPLGLRRQRPAAQVGEAIVSPPGIVQFRSGTLIQFQNQAILQQAADGSVKCSRTQVQRAAAALGCFLHDGVTVPIAFGQHQQDVEDRGSKRREIGCRRSARPGVNAFFHECILARYNDSRYSAPQKKDCQAPFFRTEWVSSKRAELALVGVIFAHHHFEGLMVLCTWVMVLSARKSL